MSFRRHLIVGLAVLLTLSSAAFPASSAGLAGQWKLNAKESDDPSKKFEEAFQKSRENDQGSKGPHGKSFERKSEARAGKKGESPFDAPEAITIENGEGSVKVTDAKGHSRTYYTDGRKTEQDMGEGRTLTFRARWEEDSLIVESQGRDGGTVTETYYLSQDGSQLYVKLQLHPIFLDQPVTIIRVYDPASPQSTQTSE